MMSDTTAPTLTALDIPTSINLSSGNVPLTITASATDNASGIDEVIVWFDKPFSTDIGSYGLVGIFGSGDSWADGSDSATRQVLSTNPAGTYTVTSVDVKDGQGNKHTYSTSELTALGFNTQIQFTGATTDMTTVQITQQVDSQNGALKVLLSSSDFPSGSASIYLSFSYESSGLEFDRIQFSGTSSSSESVSILNGSGSAVINASVIPNSSTFATLFFTGKGSGTFDLLIRGLNVNSAYALHDDPPPISYTFADTIAPALSLVSPSDGANDVQIGSNFVLTFTEAIQAGTGSFVLKNGSTTIGSINVTDASQVTINGNQVTINPLNDLNYGTNYTVISPAGIVKDLAGNNWAGTSTYDFTTASNPIVNVSVNGGLGNDLISSTQSNERINGGAGLDTVVYSGLLSQYQINAKNGVVTDTQANRDGSDTLSNVERLKFSDTMVGLDVGKGENTGEVYRLYLTVLGRNPQADAVGCGFWIDKLDNGTLTAEQMVGNFLNSTEFVSRFGATTSSNDSFINLMYINLLGRDGHPDSGFSFWLNVLNNNQASREQVVVGFMESPENVANAAPLIGDTPTYQHWVG